MNTEIRDSLPPEALAQGEPDGRGPWSRAEMLAAAQVDLLAYLLWSYGSVHAKSGKPPKPKPMPRPGVTGRRRRRISEAQWAHLEALRTGGG